MIETKPLDAASSGGGGGPSLRIKPGCEWSAVAPALRAAAPEAFSADGALLNLTGGTPAGSWGRPGAPQTISSPVDGTALGTLPMLDAAAAIEAVHAAAHEAPVWSRTPLTERVARVRATLDGMRTHREVLIKSLMWEIGKPHTLAASDVDRCIEGVAWYADNIEPMVRGRTPLGLVSNIASWNYPLSVLVHAVLV